ncbi:unnamed protein product [Sphagnum troendelagicum]|uniref:Nonsense-mediated mRNA decay factor SMG8 n=1 Tax=Sphagnum troendelagicum TaxID=128251 RepID=A0ABP0TAW0_9BRYO
MVNLVSCTDMDLKFSMAWCKRVLPSAHEVYLKGLPPCYPTSTHETHLERAQHSFHAMVRGPAVALFAEKLQADCEVVGMQSAKVGSVRKGGIQEKVASKYCSGKIALIFNRVLSAEDLPTKLYGGTSSWASSFRLLAGEVSHNISASK